MLKSLVAGLHHVAINVSELAPARAFYTSVFGLLEIPRPPTGSGREGAWLQLGTVQLHLQVRSGVAARTDQHFAIELSSFAGLADRVAERGGHFEASATIPGFRERGNVWDPDGNRIEVLTR